MKAGSIVGLKRALYTSEIDVVQRAGHSKWPILGETYEVELIRKPYYHNYPSTFVITTCIVLVEFPEYEHGKFIIDMDADLFVELLPPLVVPLMEQIEEPVMA